MSIIARLTDHVLPADCSKLSTHQAEIVDRLEEQLKSLRQYLVPVGALGSAMSTINVLGTAELYRLAALIYLERACRRKSRASTEFTCLVENTLNILEDIQVCTAVWPLFIVACEAETDSQRSMVLQVFKKTKEYRKADNISWIKRLVQGVWKQDDLFTYIHVPKAAEPMLRYGSVMSACTQLPAFY